MSNGSKKAKNSPKGKKESSEKSGKIPAAAGAEKVLAPQQVSAPQQVTKLSEVDALFKILLQEADSPRNPISPERISEILLNQPCNNIKSLTDKFEKSSKENGKTKDKKILESIKEHPLYQLRDIEFEHREQIYNIGKLGKEQKLKDFICKVKNLKIISAAHSYFAALSNSKETLTFVTQKYLDLNEQLKIAISPSEYSDNMTVEQIKAKQEKYIAAAQEIARLEGYFGEKNMNSLITNLLSQNPPKQQVNTKGLSMFLGEEVIKFIKLNNASIKLNKALSKLYNIEEYNENFKKYTFNPSKLTDFEKEITDIQKTLGKQQTLGLLKQVISKNPPPIALAGSLVNILLFTHQNEINHEIAKIISELAESDNQAPKKRHDLLENVSGNKGKMVRVMFDLTKMTKNRETTKEEVKKYLELQIAEDLAFEQELNTHKRGDEQDKFLMPESATLEAVENFFEMISKDFQKSHPSLPVIEEALNEIIKNSAEITINDINTQARGNIHKQLSDDLFKKNIRGIFRDENDPEIRQLFIDYLTAPDGFLTTELERKNRHNADAFFKRNNLNPNEKEKVKTLSEKSVGRLINKFNADLVRPENDILAIPFRPHFYAEKNALEHYIARVTGEVDFQQIMTDLTKEAADRIRGMKKQMQKISDNMAPAMTPAAAKKSSSSKKAKNSPARNEKHPSSDKLLGANSKANSADEASNPVHKSFKTTLKKKLGHNSHNKSSSGSEKEKSSSSEKEEAVTTRNPVFGKKLKTSNRKKQSDKKKGPPPSRKKRSLTRTTGTNNLLSTHLGVHFSPSTGSLEHAAQGSETTSGEKNSKGILSSPPKPSQAVNKTTEKHADRIKKERKNKNKER